MVARAERVLRAVPGGLTGYLGNSYADGDQDKPREAPPTMIDTAVCRSSSVGSQAA